MTDMYVVLEWDCWEYNVTHAVCFSRKEANKWIKENVPDERIRGYYRVQKAKFCGDVK